ncbi:two-component system sensor histidine kinase YesM [Neobacillus sp. B4I6]|uniref:cache domain-containing sensor histidine kinase n=1 Tax=Neobacillus sp. B4I6 TaxID=3373925 RepID=UPI003D1FA24A
MKKMLVNKFSTKVIIAIFISILIPSSFISVFYFVSSSNIVKENVRESSLQTAKQAADSLSFVLSVGSDMSDLLYSNRQLRDIVKMDEDPVLSSIDKEQNGAELTSFLNSQIYSSSFVRILYILKDEGTSWGSGSFSYVKLGRYRLHDFNWIQESIKKDGDLVWRGLQYDLFSGAGENTELVLPVTRVMKDLETMENIAFIQVNLDGRSILNKIEQLKLGKTGHFFVVDDQGRIMIDSNMDKINKPVENPDLHKHIRNNKVDEFEYKENGDFFYGVKQPLSNGWNIVGIVPIDEITGELAKVQRITILSSILFTLFAVVFGLFAANKVTKPIMTLTEHMRQVGKGNFKVRTHIKSNDEIGLMSDTFNQMTKQVDQLMEQVKEEQSLKTEAELRAIKHRINPHFLFNTLSTIRWLVKFKQTEKANTALSALSRLLEASMGKSGTFVTLQQELEIIERFLVILQIRYEQSFHLKLEMEAGTEEFIIPRMLIQPIVENAVFHGLVPTGKSGVISMKAYSIGKGVKIEIQDNGVGINKERLDQILPSEESKNSFIGIGLNHVYDSVRLYFSHTSSVDIKSGEHGTLVTLELFPKDGGENHV